MKDEMIKYLKSELLEKETIYKKIEIQRVALHDQVKYLDQQKKYLDEDIGKLKMALSYFGIVK